MLTFYEHRRQPASPGAIFAFPKSNASTPLASPIAGHQPGSGASAAATKTWANMKGSQPRPPTKPLNLTTASTGAVKAHQKSQESLLIHQDREYGSRASSPSHTAANIAAANYKERHPPTPSVRAVKQLPLPMAISNMHEEDNKADADKLPEQGTVKNVKKWLQALEGPDSQSQHSETTSLRHVSETSTQPRISRKSSLPPSNASPTPRQIEPSRVISPPVILSPRPVRAISTAGSIDAITPRDAASENSNHDRPPIPRKAQRLRSASSTKDTPDKRPQAPLTQKPTLTSIVSDQHGVGDVDPETISSKPSAPPPRRTRPPTTIDSDSSMPSTTPARQPANVIPVKKSVAPAARQPSRETLSSLPPKRVRATSPTTDRPRFPPRTQTDETIRQATPPPAMPPRPSVDSSITSFPPRHSQSPAPSAASTMHRSSLDLPSRPLPFRRVSPSISTSNLANAIVASSLASSRAPSPAKSPSSPAPTLPPRSSKFSLPFSRASNLSDTRIPSPSKTIKHTATNPGMRKTMREISSSSSDEAPIKSRGAKKYLHKHPHKHHEGTRKRWQNFLSDAEKKRYEGVWAANRGLLLSAKPEFKDCVHGYVVRDLWARSRLPCHVLEEVWELVRDGDGAGGEGREKEGCYLTRFEFVVGMWLIDQKLRGWKLPVRVGQSVWESARGVGGVRVPVYR
ncbi:MAG: hypothetical protein Q9159_005710 [Coniocarpon cinnabarinum]